MSSSELVRCEECGQELDTIGSPREHQKSEERIKNYGIKVSIVNLPMLPPFQEDKNSEDDPPPISNYEDNYRCLLADSNVTSVLGYSCFNSYYMLSSTGCGPLNLR